MSVRAGARPLVGVGAVLFLAAAVGVQAARDRFFLLDRPMAGRQLYVPSAPVVGRMVLGFDALAADVYWIRAIQHYGGGRLSKEGAGRRYELLYPLLDITTSLDPHFNIAYRFGAIFLSEPFPDGAGRPDLAIQLLQKGIAADPDRWLYYHDIGFVHYWTLHDPQGAADWFRRAAERPGAPNWLLPVAAAMLTQGADRAAARHLWQQILHADEEWLRLRAERGLLQLDALDQIDRLEAALREGATIESALDPAGVPYVIDPSAGRVSLSPQSPLYPLPTPKGRTR